MLSLSDAIKVIQDILQQCGYPTETVVLDAECFFDKDFNLKKLSTYDYVTDERFELLGWAEKANAEEATFGHELPQIDWKNTTIIMFNAKFDALVLALKYGIYPPFIIDVLDLARHIEPRWSNSLADLCKRHGLIDKGETKQFEGIQRAMGPATWQKLYEYATNDAERTYDLLGILLPKLSNPTFELELATWTRNLFIKPVLSFDVDRARVLKGQMQDEVNKVLTGVSWVLNAD